MSVERTVWRESPLLTGAACATWRQPDHRLNGGALNRNRLPNGVRATEVRRLAAVSYTSRRVATVETSRRLAHVIGFPDEQTPFCKAKPRGVMGAQFWVRLRERPLAELHACTILALDHTSADLAHYNDTRPSNHALHLPSAPAAAPRKESRLSTTKQRMED